MARRSSARLRNRNSSTPKRVSLSHDAPTRTPRTAPVKLTTVREDGDMPGAFPSSASPPSRTSIDHVNKSAIPVPVKFGESTPKDATPIKPSEEEMHPKQYQQSTAKPLEEARWLGFSNMYPQTEPARKANSISHLQGTPTKTSKSGSDIGSPRFRFTFGREQSLELSPEAKKLMDEKREEAAKIRELMVANGEGSEGVAEALQRKIALPKGKKGRFSDAHMEQFKKMDSIATHVSKTNKVSDKLTLDLSAHKVSSLKRTASKARLDDADVAQQAMKSTPSKVSEIKPPSSLPRPASVKDLQAKVSQDFSSPTKRMKQGEKDDVSTRHPFSSPTQASLARVSSIKSAKSSKIPAPAPFRSPSKPSLLEQDASKTSTPLLSRSPAKASLFSRPLSEITKDAVSPLLKRSPTKSVTFQKESKPEATEEGHESKTVRLLSCSPLKMSVAKDTESEEVEDKSSSSIPLLYRSPAKVTLPNVDVESQQTQTPVKSTSGNIMGRFNLLRSSPMKSILRSPQRLYSNDPAKVAAGTHLASPAGGAINRDKPLPTPKEATPSTEKHVDFTSSTKARYERAQSEASSSASKGPTSPAKPSTNTESASKPMFAEYPSLPSTANDTVVTPQKRRQTAAPYDFTFTSHGNGIVFGQSPNAPMSAANSKSPSTIRHVSAEPQFPPAPAPATGSKKRKFDFENDKAKGDDKEGDLSDKENAEEVEEGRPAKRVKPSVLEPPKAKPATRLPTLGVRPKNEKAASGKPKTISRARLNALAQPKRRG